MLGRWIGIVCGTWLVAVATSAPAQLPSTAAPPNLQAPPTAAPYDGATVPAAFNNPVNNPVTAPPAAVTPPSREPLPLSPPEARSASKLPLPKIAGDGSTASRAPGGSSTSTVLIALAVVLGLFLGLVALLRRGMPNQTRTLPAEAVELLGRIALPGRRQGHLIRVGNKITLVSFANNETRPLIEITDPLEIDRLAGLCKQADPTSATRSFRSVVDGFFREKTSRETEARDE